MNMDVDTVWSNWKKLFLSVVDKHAPVISKRIRGLETPWLSSKIKSLMYERHYNLRNARANNSELFWRTYKKLSNTVTAEIRKAKSNFNKKLLEENMDNPSKFWKSIKIITSGNKTKTNPPIRVKSIFNDKVTETDADTATTLGIFFSRVAERTSKEFYKLHPALTSLSSVPAYILNSSNVGPNVFNFKEIEICNIYNHLRTLKTTKAIGLDGIPAKLLRDSASVIAPSITSLFNLSLSTSTFPSDWKLARIIPIYKGKARNDPSNYRPISILPTLSKILEREVHKQLSTYLEALNLISGSQFGFRKKYSCPMAITLISDTIRKNSEAGLLTGAVFLDVQKAFDTVSHPKLLSKLRFFGIRDNELNWFEDYLLDRYIQVGVNGALCSSFPVNSEVPQGSILGPLLFIMHMNDLLLTPFTGSNLIMYADDTVIYFAAKTTAEIIDILNEDLKIIGDWAINNEIYLHQGKLESVLFGTHKRRSINEPLKVQIYGLDIKSSLVYKYL
ncbi:Hypothetical predicted protein, partial [Paramuricea clavata]